MNKFLFLILPVLYSFSESEWNLQKKEDAIEIYTRSIAGSSFDEFRGITTIEKTTLSDVLAIILDVEKYERLYPECMNPKILKKDGHNSIIEYMQIKAPWPVKTRDSIYEIKTTIDENGKHAIVSLKPLPGYIAENSEMVRIRKGEGFWELNEISNNKVKIIYQFHSEPGGDIPAWLSNSFVVNHPYETLLNLKKRLKN